MIVQKKELVRWQRKKEDNRGMHNSNPWVDNKDSKIATHALGKRIGAPTYICKKKQKG